MGVMDEIAAKKEDDNYVKNKEDAMICLELECNQTFVGMIQLQYQVSHKKELCLDPSKLF